MKDELTETEKKLRRALAALVLSVAGGVLLVTGVVAIEVYEWQNPDLTDRRVFLNLLLSWQSACVVGGILMFVVAKLLEVKK